MDKETMYIALFLYGPVAVVSIFRAILFSRNNCYVEDKGALASKQFAWFLLCGIGSLITYYSKPARIGFQFTLLLVISYLLLYPTVSHFLCWIISLVWAKAEKEADKPVGIGTDPNTPDLTPETIIKMGEHKEQK